MYFGRSTDEVKIRRRISMAERCAVLFGIYLNFSSLQKAVDSLKKIGFRTNDISVLFPEGALDVWFHSSECQDCPGEGEAEDTGSDTLIGGSLGWLTCMNLPAAGELAGALVKLGIPAYEAERYEGRIRNGGILMAVRSSSPILTDRLRDLFLHTGAESMSITGQAKACNGSPLREGCAPRREAGDTFSAHAESTSNYGESQLV
jgi:hypothetical protein